MHFASGPSSYKEDSTAVLLPPKEAEFREYLCDSGAAMELVRLLVGLAEANNKPENPVAYLREMFDAQELPDMVSGQPRDDIPALLEENAALKERDASLTAQLATAVGKIEEAEAAVAAGIIDSILGAGACASESGDLDVTKLYAAVSSRFPVPPEDAETPFAWAAEDAAVPEGTATVDNLKAWAKATFGWGSPAPWSGRPRTPREGADAAQILRSTRRPRSASTNMHAAGTFHGGGAAGSSGGPGSIVRRSTQPLAPLPAPWAAITSPSRLGSPLSCGDDELSCHSLLCGEGRLVRHTRRNSS